MADLATGLRSHVRIGLDTPVFIYHIDGNSQFAEAAGDALGRLSRGEFEGITSVLTLMELAVRPLQLGRPDVADEYEMVLATYPHLTVASIEPPIARRAAELRATYRLRPADALQVAACLELGATAFLTNDNGLRRVSELEVLVLGECVI